MHRRPDGTLILAATDLVGFLNCGHLTQLDRAAAAGLIRKPDRSDDPEVELLQRRGHAHEKRYVEHLESERRTITDLSSERDGLAYEALAARTKEAMRRGDDVIYQATVFDGRWVGFPDFLLRVDRPAVRNPQDGFGTAADDERPVLGRDWHYEIADTKLAHTAKASALIQMCAYVEQIERIQDVLPEKVYVVTGGATPDSHVFRTAEMMAYYRHAKRRFEDLLDETEHGAPVWPIDMDVSYPDPVDHCAVCRYFPDYCRPQWRRDDALPLVAGITRGQRQELAQMDVRTRSALAVMAAEPKVAKRFERVREQARLQVETGDSKIPVFELLEPEKDSQGTFVSDRGLSALPPPSEHDLFFDIEGDPFAFWEGLEYLFGVWQQPAGGAGLWDQDGYQGFWGQTRADERKAFERVMDLFIERWRRHPDMHVYHYGVYEPSHLKILAGRHATREEDLDQLLRGRVFVDLYRVVRQGVRVGAERYSIKNLEPLYGYTRDVDLRDANSSIVEFESLLENGDPGGELRAKIEAYNRDDCRSTELLRDWLEARRTDAQQKWGELPRPALGEVEEEKPELSDKRRRVRDLEERLTASISKIEADQTEVDKRTWMVRHLVDWHRRENKASWWRFFELMSLSDYELVEEPEPIGGLKFVERIPREGKNIRTDYWRYRYPPQEHKVDVGNEVHDPEITVGKTVTGTVAAIDEVAGTIDIRRSRSWDGRHPEAIVVQNIYRADAQHDSLMRFGEWVAQNGVDADSPEWQAARDLLRRRPPRVVGGSSLDQAGESGAQKALRLATQLDGTTLAIQGPPGSGKTYIGARMILALVRAGKRVGVTANSHKVISNLLEAVGKATDEAGRTLRGMQKVDGEDGCRHSFVECVDSNSRVVDALNAGEVEVVGGTAWLWSREDMSGLVDTLFVDEAGQMSLANVVAMSGAARNIVLLGDPQQLDQPTQGAHPDGAGVSALAHLLGELETIPPERGVFLEKTWRMHPQITSFTSELFYEGKLESVPGLEAQAVSGNDWLSGSGVRWVAVRHDGNRNESPEEAEVVVDIIRSLVGREWTDQDGRRHPITQDSIRIVSPFNAHRLLIDRLLDTAELADVQVGTVDKFQGQEAPVSIYTMATSRPEEAPRGLGFLLSLNRLNVATSRARALAIVVCSPTLLQAKPNTPAQLRMVNGLCAFAETAARA